MTQVLGIALALVLAQGAGAPREKAREYLEEGRKALRAERFERALKALDMASGLARFAFGQDEMVGETLALASEAALGIGDASSK